MSELTARRFWILEHPGLGSTMRNYSVKFEDGPYATMFSNLALTNYWHVIEVSAVDQLQSKLTALEGENEQLKLEAQVNQGIGIANSNLRDKVTALKEENERLRYALKIIAATSNIPTDTKLGRCAAAMVREARHALSEETKPARTESEST